MSTPIVEQASSPNRPACSSTSALCDQHKEALQSSTPPSLSPSRSSLPAL